MHVAIKALTVNEEAYVNRKGAHTINVHEAAGRRRQVASQLTRQLHLAVVRSAWSVQQRSAARKMASW